MFYLDDNEQAVRSKFHRSCPRDSSPQGAGKTGGIRSGCRPAARTAGQNSRALMRAIAPRVTSQALPGQR